jgi:hypothetical protein
LRQAEVSPDGTHLVFQSKASITGFENEGAVEVFVYSAAEGKVVCASCDAAGTPPPEGEEAGSGKLTVSAESLTYLHRWMSGDGDRVFFNTSQSLVPGDVNGVEDVYEWEREGTGSCPVQVPVSVVGGCQFLISGGQSEGASLFVDADESGDNAFFVHTGVLGDTAASAEQMELYDARVGGGFSSSSTGCSGASCSATPAAAGTGAAFGAPASATFSGPANFAPEPASIPSTPPITPKKTVKKSQTRAQQLARALKACSKDHGKHARTICERAARRRYGAVKKGSRQ